MKEKKRSRAASGWLVLAIVALVLAFYFLMRRAEERLAEDALQGYLGEEAQLTEEERQKVIDHLMDEIESTR